MKNRIMTWELEKELNGMQNLDTLNFYKFIFYSESKINKKVKREQKEK